MNALRSEWFSVRCILLVFYRLDVSTMVRVREWERFQFRMDYEHVQVPQFTSLPYNCLRLPLMLICHSAKKSTGTDSTRTFEAVDCQKDRKQSFFQGAFCWGKQLMCRITLGFFRFHFWSARWAKLGLHLLQRCACPVVMFVLKSSTKGQDSQLLRNTYAILRSSFFGVRPVISPRAA